MKLTESDIKNIAHLARLGVDQQDIGAYTQDLSGILDLMQQMSVTNTNTIEPMAHPMDQVQRLRTDVVSEVNNRKDFQAIAPLVEDGLYLVPKVIE